MNDFHEESSKIIQQMLQILLKKNLKDNINNLKLFFPDIDSIIEREMLYFTQNVNIPKKLNINPLLKQKIKYFLNHKPKSLMLMITKTFENFNRNLNFLDSKIKNYSSIFIKTLSNNKSDLNIKLAQKRSELELILDKDQKNQNNEINLINKKLENIKITLEQKFNYEIERLNDHFNHLIKEREDSLEFTNNSISKSKFELNEIIQKKDLELKLYIENNEKVLNQHKESIESKLYPNESKLKELEKKYE